MLFNAISVWNTVYLSQAADFKRSTGTFKYELLLHISPLRRKHINFLV
ncbi:transposase [Fodinisporobacter ferrooxydans]|uniref:Transposase n=1 Tax=Fodinisporobacter ferrooxydans TaxID=2901836 RepID=A0ABY4CJB8_9BACL|nr:transposase [Alicyclobacillaceae bacterium MYW30-H2]